MPDFAVAHRRYTGYINTRMRVTGHLWQGRFGSVVMDEPHLAHTVRYVSLHPIRAKLVARAQNWKWSSIAAHLSGRNDGLVTVVPVLERYGDFSTFLDSEYGRTSGIQRSSSCGSDRPPLW